MLRERGANAKDDAIRLLTQLQADIDRFRADVVREAQSSAEARQTLSRWIAVMLVTFVETYLQDVMAEVARIEPEIMNNTKQAAEYDDIINAASIADLAGELRSRWARNFTGDGGPTKWASRLANRGAGEYDPDVVASMERLWGVRHVVIHNAGRANHGFIRRHKPAAVTVGDLVPITDSDVSAWLTAIGSFVDQTDKHFVGYLKGRGGLSSGSSFGA